MQRDTLPSPTGGLLGADGKAESEVEGAKSEAGSEGRMMGFEVITDHDESGVRGLESEAERWQRMGDVVIEANDVFALNEIVNIKADER